MKKKEMYKEDNPNKPIKKDEKKNVKEMVKNEIFEDIDEKGQKKFYKVNDKYRQDGCEIVIVDEYPTN